MGARASPCFASLTLHAQHTPPLTLVARARSQIRHDDVVYYQQQHHANCLIHGPAPCLTQPNPCELILYQSLNSTGTTGGDGLTGLTHAQKDANDHDADGNDNDKMALPKYANTRSNHTPCTLAHCSPFFRFPLRSQYMAYNGTILPDPAPYHQVRTHTACSNNSNHSPDAF